MKLQQVAIWQANGIADKDMKIMLKTQGIDTRRLSKQTLFALSGALLLDKKQISCDTAQFLGASFSSLSVFRKMRANVAEHVAMPLDLLAHLHNAPVFHTAATLNLTGASSVCVVWHGKNEWQTPLYAAHRSLVCGVAQSALVGWVFEGETEADKAFEGAIWLHMVANNAAETVFRLPENISCHDGEHFMHTATAFAREWAQESGIQINTFQAA